ncbi:hypothetical protein AKO1_004887 [Acrasis kona]|uniref:HEAT repeat-containing protein 1 n=1 Tax=Acrasis kona TaxID=1008807 RepID=A0AAW2YWN5_9EUKA
MAMVDAQSVLQHIDPVMRAVSQSTLDQQDGASFDAIEKAIMKIVTVVDHDQLQKVCNTFASLYRYIPHASKNSFYHNVVKTAAVNHSDVLFNMIKSLLASQHDDQNDSDDLIRFSHSLMDKFSVSKQLSCNLRLVRDGEFEFVLQRFDQLNWLQKISQIQPEQEMKPQKLLTLMCGVALEHFHSNSIANDLILKCEQLLTGEFFTNLIDLATQSGQSVLIRRKGLDMLNQRLNSISQSSELPHQRITSMLQIIICDEQQDYVLLQYAVMCIESTCNQLKQDGDDQDLEFMIECIPHLLDLFKIKNKNIDGSTCMCLATICNKCGYNVIPYINSIIESIMNTLNDSLSRGTDDHHEQEERAMDTLRISSLASLDVICRHHIDMLAPFLNQMVPLLLNAAIYRSKLTKRARHSNKTSARAGALLSHLASHLDARLIMHPLLSSHQQLCTLQESHSIIIDSGDALCSLSNVISHAITCMDQESVMDHLNAIVDYLMIAFDTRRLHFDDASMSNEMTLMNSIEDELVGVVRALTLKCNDKLFGDKVLLPLVNWCRRSGSDDQQVDQPYAERLIILYKLFNMWNDLLGTMFVPYYSSHDLLTMCSNDLEALHQSDDGQEQDEDDEDEEQVVGEKRSRRSNDDDEFDLMNNDDDDDDEHDQITHDLIMSLLNVLIGCFKNDFEGNIGLLQSQSKLDVIMQPLVDQISNAKDGRLLDRSQLLSECLGLLCQITSSHNWKTLQYQVLIKTQGNVVADVKIAAANALESFYDHVGQSFVVNLPEMIPYVAELLEDDNKGVVLATQKLVSKVEKVTGENFAQYLQ